MPVPEKYARYLEEAYLLYVLNRFSHKFKEQLKAPKKAYFVDTGFLAAKAFQVSRNSGRLMENAVFIELVRRGYVPNESLFYYKTRNKKEVDFILREGTKVQGLIQVCLDLDSEGARKREHGALIEAGEELDCRRLTILSRDTEAREPVKGGEIEIVPLWKWLTQGAP
ncbi:MAG: ATP-binding protein [Candidatus Omnitrophica bacterium]|nr:ATP-binding protein [Candidatus Omnitrophota bacterium]